MSIFTTQIQETVFRATQILDCSPMIKYLGVPSTSLLVFRNGLMQCFSATASQPLSALLMNSAAYLLGHFQQDEFFGVEQDAWDGDNCFAEMPFKYLVSCDDFSLL